MKRLGINIGFAPYIVVLAVVLSVSACARKVPDTLPYDRYLSGWMGASEDDLVVAFGIPDSSHVLAGGGRVLEYRVVEKDELVCTTRFTVDHIGRVGRWWYKGTKCRSPSSGTAQS